MCLLFQHARSSCFWSGEDRFCRENSALTPDTPLILIDPSSSPIAPLKWARHWKFTVRMNLLVLVRESAPADWFNGIIDVMGDVVDAILAIEP